MVLSSVIAGASGGVLANAALTPLSGGAGMLQSYWYGAGLILGERMMYTFHWEKMHARLDKGEDFLSVLESEMNPAITAIANYSLTIMKKTGELYMQGGIDFMAKLIENMLKMLAGEVVDPIFESPPPIEPTEPPLIQCPAGFRWSQSAQQCVPEDIVEPPPPPPEPLIKTWNSSFQLRLQDNLFIIVVSNGEKTASVTVRDALWTYMKFRQLMQEVGTAVFFTDIVFKLKAAQLTFMRNFFPHITTLGETLYMNFGTHADMSALTNPL